MCLEISQLSAVANVDFYAYKKKQEKTVNIQKENPELNSGIFSLYKLNAGKPLIVF